MATPTLGYQPQVRPRTNALTPNTTDVYPAYAVDRFGMPPVGRPATQSIPAPTVSQPPPVTTPTTTPVPTVATAPQTNPAQLAPVALPTNYAAPQTINQPSQYVPPTGLIGSENALLGGFVGATNAMNEGQAGAEQAFGNSAQLGLNANTIQADLTGANGPDKQQAAMNSYQNNPAMKYQMDQVIKGRERSAAARGGLFSGNTGLELNRDLAGVMSQNFQQDFNNLGVVADRGTQVASRLADLRSNLGLNKAQLATQTGSQLSSGRTNAGLAIAQNASNTASGISNLLSQQGIKLSENMTKDLDTIANLIHESGMGDKADNSVLAQILANISSGQASNLQQGYQNIGNAQAAGIMGTNTAVQNGLTQATQLGAFSSTPSNNSAQSLQLGSSRAGYTDQYAPY